MRFLLLQTLIIALLVSASAPGALLGAQNSPDSLSIVSLAPAANQSDASASATVSVVFNQPVAGGDFNADTFVIYGERAGAVSGVLGLSADSLTLTFTPDVPFIYGDRITAILVKQPAALSPVLQKGYVWEFDIAPNAGRPDFASSSFESKLRLTSITSADLNNDGLVDLAMTGSDGFDDFLKLAYLTDNGLVFGDSLILPDRVRPLYSADLNRDGYPDFVMLHRGMSKFAIPPRISICHLKPNGALSLEETFTVDSGVTGRSEPRAAVITDINADGYLDIVVQMKNNTPKAAFIYLNDGTGHFFHGPSAVPWFDAARNAESIFDRDLNLTGSIDIGIGHTSSYASAVIYLNDGDANFVDSGSPINMLNRDLENARSLDLTGDLRPDIILADFNNSQVLVYDWLDTNIVDSTKPPVPLFSASPRVYSSVQSPNWMDYADVDHDGDLDLVLTGSNQNYLQILLNNNGDFDQSLDVSIPPQPGNFAVGDVNGDAALDFIVADTSGTITVLYNNIADYVAPQTPSLIRPADSSFQDLLHFLLRLSSAGGETDYDSRINPELFSPSPPFAQGVGTAALVPPQNLADGEYRWTVQAWDGMFWSDSSQQWLLNVDATPPALQQLVFPKADFNGEWFAIAGDSTIAAEIVYSEWNPDYAELNTNGLGGPFRYDTLAAGNGVSAELLFLPQSSSDGKYRVSVKLVDKAAQNDTISGLVGVDRNPPQGATASAAGDTSASADFRISWSGGTDGSGSGVSGAYRVHYRRDGGPWTLWIEKTFQSGVFVDKFANDKVAPPPPQNLRANGGNPSPWQKTNNFTVRWDLPPDDSGIKDSFWKRGAAPTANSDFDAGDGPSGPAEVSIDQDGVTPFYVWLSDSAGNVDYRNAGLVNLRRDATLPAIHAMKVEGAYIAPVMVAGVPWFNSQSDKYFTTRVDYSEVNAKKGVLTTDGLSDSLINTGPDLAVGENVTTLFELSIQNPADRIYVLKSTIIDSADNKSSKTLSMGLDGRPPQNSLASAPAISDTVDFLVSWSAGDDGSGSGIESYDLYYKVNENSWRLWFTTDSVGSQSFHGQNGFEYRFESVAKDYMGFTEERSAAGEAVVVVDLAANDKQAPPPPINLQANGSRPASAWTANAGFNITWKKPEDLSGVVASYWKLGEPPVSNADTMGTGPAEGSMIVHMTETGKQWLYLWLIDAKGNVDFNNADSVLLRFDNTPPKIASTQFLDPGYGEDWYNPAKADSAHLEVTYHESFAGTLSLKSDDWNYNLLDTAPISGVGMKKVFALALANRQTGAGELIVAMTDSAGNTTQAVDTLRLDDTSPQGSTAGSPAASGSTSFQVSWSPGTDVGVGVSDTFDVWVKVGEEGWLPWQINYVGRSAVFTDGEDQHTYHFESVGRDWLGNVENRTYAYETSTYVDITLADSIAPAAPIDLQADGGNPSPWRKKNEFQVTWKSPPDPTGTPRGWFKLGAPPTSQIDTSGSFIGDPPLTILATRENGQRLHVWLQDGADNVDFRNYASVLLKYDATPPKIDSLFLDAAYAHRWYNPRVPPHTANLDVYFSERNPTIVHLDPSALFAPDSVALRAGQDSASFEMNFEGLGDADVGLKVTLLDSAGNAAEGAAMLSLDRTPPRNTLAQSPDTTKPGDFTISWDVSQAVENGSGLSGAFDIKVQIDDGAWELWKARWNATSAVYTGEEGHKYSFEVAAYDNVGNKEEFLNQAESTTWVVTQFVDTTPPDAPTNIWVNGSHTPQWSRDAVFHINWTQPADPSGISKVFYKFDAPPENNNDFDGQAAGTPPIDVEMTEDAVRPLYIWLQDGAGNSDATKYGVAQLKYDGTPPVIIKSIVANAVYNNQWINPDSTETAQIRVTFTEYFADSLKLFFTGSAAPIKMTELTSGESQQVDVILSLKDVGDGLYPLAVVLQDSAGNASRDSIFVGLDSTPPDGATASSPKQSITGKFSITWAGDGAGADAGSGLSGEYDLRMRIGETGQWFEVLNREKVSSYTYVGTHNNRFYFEVAAWDNTGNREAFIGEPETSTLVDTAFIDTTPPQAPVELVVRGKNPSPWQNQPEFLVNWKNPVDPSGIAVAYYKLGGPPQSAADYSDSVAVENEVGSASITATKENGQMVYLWLKDGRGNSKFENSALILLRYDPEPPQIVSITPLDPAFGVNWYNQVETPTISFDIAFSEAHPDSLVLSNDLFGGVLADIAASGKEVDSLRLTVDIKDVPDGTYQLYAALVDSAGSASETDSVIVNFDAAPPRVTLALHDTVTDAGKAVAVSAAANDENPLQSVDLVYWQGGRRQRQFIPMQHLDDSTYVADIPGDAVTARGLEYLIQASDGVNITRYPLTADNPFPMMMRVRVSGENGNGVTMPQPLPFGSEETAYRLLSFPLDMAQRPAKDILEPVLGAYDIKVWRFFYWSALSDVFLEYPDIASINDGLGYWIITSKPDVRLHTGQGLSMNTIAPYIIVLKQGWNDIGLPFDFSVDWADIIAASAVDTQKVQGPHGYEGRWIYPFENKILQPWQGYSIYADVDDISLIIPALEARPVLEKNQPLIFNKKLEWAFEIKAVNGEAVDAANYFGCSKSATLKWDYGLDYVEAPEIGAYVSLYFPHQDWALSAQRYTSDFRPPQNGHVWDFEVATQKTKGDIKLSFRAITSLPNSLQLHLLDTAANMKIDLISDSVYTFQLSDEQQFRQFKIFAGDAEFMQEHEEELPETPTQYELVQNYPNPFNNSTIISYQLERGTDVTLAVYNLLAQKVKTLRSGRQEKGFYQVRWDARDDQNTELGTGVYILRLETPEFTSTRKMVYMR